MIGMLFIGFFLLYGFISSKVVRWATAWAKNRGKNPKLWGILAALVMFSLVFWDLIPTYAVHSYYCHMDSGISTFKTLDEWAVENTGAVGTLVQNKNFETGSKIINGNIVSQINNRFTHVSEKENVLFGIRRHVSRIIDSKTEQVLIERINYDTNVRSFAMGARSLRDYKIWLDFGSCQLNPKHVQEMRKYIKEIQSM